jgi:sulfate permease, SulP family
MGCAQGQADGNFPTCDITQLAMRWANNEKADRQTTRTTALALITVAILVVCRLVSNRIPGAIVALLMDTASVMLFKLPVETIGSRFEGIPSGLPHFAMPRFRVDFKPASLFSHRINQ